MIDTVGRFMAGITSVALTLALVAASAWLMSKVMARIPEQRTENRELALGCTIWLAFFLLLGLLFWPSIHVLKSYSCGKAEDYELCMDPPESDPM
ncbi:MAG: hypothetical protein B7Y36_08355 [Novosphingobium sp. 28-62-57]|uniref:hypothetical protein n=1 Tax=unclassified Novosphingobium TaxID=2644732 RepID=UPI000BD7FB43|nr:MULTISPECIES: hypothetical protein [unclassified Novosphingobium]OYW47935.1 MAG: hypothetical protein B7Z36_01445 [Novosphingobium sp. 12-63-9]OYZ10828.1 MAG: hypothetical protein B7Y36_08355 [Novosphingobium sp. 28-62-57]OZA32841.1 MAG: hypothetical protein B7X92_12065 [Novosphingobium sp. 17-62-9]HQS70017.1 hypothetical protein [Novosphingobium sp.]